MREYVNVTASETLEQIELVAFLKGQFPQRVRVVGRPVTKGTECVEVRVPSKSDQFEGIRRIIGEKRKQGLPAYSDFAIGSFLRKYSKTELQNFEADDPRHAACTA